jgi:methylated-DNA-[protein]-cysteine S-methyltransferase
MPPDEETRMTRTHTSIDSPIGELTLVATDGVLSGLYMHRQRRMPDPATFGPRTSAGFEEATRQLAEYFARERTGFTMPLHMEGGSFERRVWLALTRIPYGQTRSYTELTEEVVGPRAQPDRFVPVRAGAEGLEGVAGWEAVRAVGAANGRNPLAIVVPCHRVVGADGSLTGYAGGLERKRFLLDLEAPAEVRQRRLFV